MVHFEIAELVGLSLDKFFSTKNNSYLSLHSYSDVKYIKLYLLENLNYLKVTFLSKVFLFIIAIFLLAYVVMFHRYVFHPFLIKAADRSVAVYVAHVYLLGNYVLWINGLMNHFDLRQAVAIPAKQRYSCGLGFLLLGLCVVVVVHLFFLEAGLRQTDVPNYSCLLCLFFLLMLVGWLFSYFPKTRLFNRVEEIAHIKQEWQLLSWRENSDPTPVLPYLRKKHNDAAMLPAYYMLDVVIVECVNMIYFAHFSDGKVWMINYSKKEFQEAKALKWFVKISRQRYVNMLYVRYPIIQNKRLYLQADISRLLFKGDSKREEEFLLPSRRMQKNIRIFLLSCAKLDLEGWDEKINLK